MLRAALRQRVRTLLNREEEPTAREQQSRWIEWMSLDGMAESTIAGYRQITDRFLARWPELRMSEFTDDIITGFIEEANPASRQQRRGAFSNWFKWAARTKRNAGPNDGSSDSPTASTGSVTASAGSATASPPGGKVVALADDLAHVASVEIVVNGETVGYGFKGLLAAYDKMVEESCWDCGGEGCETCGNTGRVYTEQAISDQVSIEEEHRRDDA